MTVTTKLARHRATFAHGVHPAEWKELAADVAIEVLPTPPIVRVPLQQHLGAVCEATVKPRTEVALGDVVGDSDSFVSAPVHASVVGTTTRGTVATLPNGRHVPAVSIRAAEQQPLAGRALFEEIYGGPWLTEGFERYEPQQIIDAIRQAGLVGLGGAAFPTHVKLAHNKAKPIQWLLVNGCECEPYLTGDYRLMLEAPAAILTGVRLAQRVTGAAEVIICIEDNKPKAIESMRAAANGTGVDVRVLKTKYPQGGEKQLISAVVHREVPTGRFPPDIGVTVVNVSTAAAIARAVVQGKPLTHRVVTVSGRGIEQPKNLLVPIGASYQNLVDYCGGLRHNATRVVAGGPMMGFTLGSLDVPVTKGTSGLVVLADDEVRKSKETACVRCGRCVAVCPMRLVPTKLALAGRAGDPELARRYHVAACIECGCCAYTCPARIPLVQLIRVAKIMAR